MCEARGGQESRCLVQSPNKCLFTTHLLLRLGTGIAPPSSDPLPSPPCIDPAMVGGAVAAWEWAPAPASREARAAEEPPGTNELSPMAAMAASEATRGIREETGVELAEPEGLGVEAAEPLSCWYRITSGLTPAGARRCGSEGMVTGQ